MSEVLLNDATAVTAVKCANCDRQSPAEILKLSMTVELGLPGRPPFLNEVVAYRIKLTEPDWFWTVNELGQFFMFLCPQCVKAMNIECEGLGCSLDKGFH